MTWTERLTRVFAIDLSIAPDCGGRLRVIVDARARYCLEAEALIATTQG